MASGLELFGKTLILITLGLTYYSSYCFFT